MSSIAQKLDAVLTLGRISNLPTVWTNCLAAFLLNRIGQYSPIFTLPDTVREGFWGPEDASLLGWIILGASLIYVAGTTLNDAFDVEFDRKHNPERPIPSGVMKTWEVWFVGFAELIGGAAILFYYAKVSPVYLVLLCLTILAYDAVHKKWSGSLWLMGACRLFLWWTVASASLDAGEKLSNLVYVWSITLLLYIAGITFVAKGEATGKLPKIPWPFFLLFAPVLMGLFFCLYENHLAGLPVLLALYWGVRKGVLHAQKKGPSIGKGVGLWLALITVGDALAIALVLPVWGYLCLLAFPLCLWTQKRFAAT